MSSSTAETLFINTIFSVALEKKATDIHLLAGNYPVLRLDRKLFVLADEKILTIDTIGNLVDSWLSEDEKKRLVTEKEVRTVYTWANRARFRITVYYQQGYPAISIHAIPQDIPDPKTFQLPKILLDKIALRQGLIIICGPFNSGRTTTVASLLQHINATQGRRIVTLERPIEYLLVNQKSMVNQREVGKDTPSFAQGLDDLLDDDSEVVALSETSEEGIEKLILTLVESGKLVLLVINATSSISALEKFIGNIQKDQRNWAKDSLIGVLLAIVAQRLVPAVGGGRILACEVLTMTPAVASIIQEEKFPQLSNVLQTSREEGMVSLDYRLLELVKAGKVSAQEAKAYALDPSNIR